MKSLFTCIFSVTVFMQPMAALAANYSDFDLHCQVLLQNESALIKEEIEEGYLTEAEAEEEFDYDSEMEQCVCFYQKVLEGGGEDFISYLQKADIILMNDDYTSEDMKELEFPKTPKGLDIEALFIDSAKACGIDTEQ